MAIPFRAPRAIPLNPSRRARRHPSRPFLTSDPSPKRLCGPRATSHCCRSILRYPAYQVSRPTLWCEVKSELTTSVSAKGPLYNNYIASPEDVRKEFFVDPILANREGHQLIADVLASYLQTQICAGWAATMGHAFDVPYMGAPPEVELSDGSNSAGSTSEEALAAEGGGLAAKMRAVRVPKSMLSDRPSDILKFREVGPCCVSANDLINPLPPSHFFGSGWFAHHPAKGKSREERHYWYAELGGSKFRVPIQLSAGDVAIYYLQ